MNLVDKNFFGPQEFTARILEYPPYTTDVKARRWGYESGKHLVDVVVLERPVKNQDGSTVSRYYQDNGKIVSPHAVHRAIEVKFNLKPN